MTIRLNPYLVMNGNGREAIAFYEKALDAKVVSVTTFGEAPSSPDQPMPEGVKDRIMHALLKVGEVDLMLSDAFPGGMPFQSGNQVNLTLVTDSVDSSKQLFEALAEGGQVNMPMQETFWSPAYGQLKDKFGVEWQISTAVTA